MAKEVSIKLHPKLAKAQAALEKRMSLEDIIVKPSFELEFINTGSTVFNLLIGGSRLPNGKFVCPGYPKGTMIEIFGRESSGKSTAALTAMGHALRQNGNQGTGVYVDLEHAVKDNYAQKLGVDFRPPQLGGHGRAIRVAPHYFEETEQIVNHYAAVGVDLIVIDSVAGLVSKRELNRDTTKDSVSVAEIPRLMSQWLPKLQAIIARTKTTVIFINQTRDKIGQMGYNEEVIKSTTGGNALKFWAALRILLTPKQQAKAKRYNPIIKMEEEVPVATDVLIKMVKNKIDARQGHTGMVTIRYGVGMDELRTMLNVALAYKVVREAKNAKKQDVYTFAAGGGKDVIEAIGIEKFRVALQRNPAAFAEMNARATECILQGFKAIDDEELAQLAEDAVTTSMEDPSDSDFSEQYANEPEETEVVDAVSGVDYDKELFDNESAVAAGPSAEDLS